MGFTRRAFLQGAGLALTAWGVSDIGLWRSSNRYRAALAASTPRKLALLIGINQYPGTAVLEGCVTDVELQRELLIHRFGLRSPDILTLTDQQATREAIETAFVEHLINQAKPDDVVVFHFSGFGSTLSLRSEPEKLQTSLVTVDGVLPNGDVPLVNDVLDETLWLLLRSLKTTKVTAILDTSYLYPGNPFQGNLRVRAYPNPSMAHPIPSESAFQAQLLSQLQLTREQLANQRSVNPFPGIGLSPGQLATETRWGKFSAGLFTYALTQSLWQATTATTVQINLAQVSEQVGQWVSQPQSQIGSQKVQGASLSPYWLKLSALGADGVVTALEEEGKTVQLWLGGLPARLIDAYGLNSLVTLLPQKSHQGLDPNRPLNLEPLKSQPLKLQIIAREGLSAKAKIYSSRSALNSSPEPIANIEDTVPIQLGQWVQETVRVLPRNVGLTVALDGNLERIERVDAISALSAVPRISSAIAGEQPADYLFSKVEAGQVTQLASLPTTTALPSVTDVPNTTTGGYSLFSPGRDVLLNTIGEEGEAVKVAVRRLVPKLQTLLANKLLSLTINDKTSQLPVRATLELLRPQERLLLQQATMRAPGSSSSNPPNPTTGQTAELLRLPLGSQMRYQIQNLSAQAFHWLLLGLDTTSNLVSLLPSDNTQLLPATVASVDWILQGPPGQIQTYLICSGSPFAETLTALITGQHSAILPPVGTPIANPLDVVQAILQDLHNASEISELRNLPDIIALDVNTWATLPFTYQVM